jgi:hypothetical protein
VVGRDLRLAVAGPEFTPEQAAGLRRFHKSLDDTG